MFRLTHFQFGPDGDDGDGESGDGDGGDLESVC